MFLGLIFDHFSFLRDWELKAVATKETEKHLNQVSVLIETHTQSSVR